jgi:hypothetical protein
VSKEEKGQLLKSVNVNQLEVDRHQVDVKHLQSNSLACTTDETGELDHGVFRVNISTTDIDLWELIMLQFIDTINGHCSGLRLEP